MAEKMIRCAEGHFYDPSKHNACPWCVSTTEAGLGGGEITRAIRPPAPEPMPPPLPPAGAGMMPPAGAGMLPPVPSMLPAVPNLTTAVPSMPPPPPPPVAASPALAVTRRGGMDSAPGRPDPVVGWLVCLEGPDRGRDFRLHSEKNFVGRAPNMDVCIPSDDAVSREKHGVIIFDPKKQVFWAVPGDSSGLVYVNSEIVHAPVQLKRDDIIEIGQSKLVLVPFCGERYSWSAPPAPAG
jgi:hypothetical protein